MASKAGGAGDGLDAVRDEYGHLRVLDDIIRHRAADDPPQPILGYPRRDTSIDDYEYFTGAQLDRFVDACARLLVAEGFEPVPKNSPRQTVALLAPSNVDYVVTLFALSRLGYAVLCLSLRIQPVAVCNLLAKTDCTAVVYGPGNPRLAAVIEAVGRESPDTPLQAVCVPTGDQYRAQEMLPAATDQEAAGATAATATAATATATATGTGRTVWRQDIDPDEETHKVAMILHSSGSTGLPKPIFLPHRALLTHAVLGPGFHNFCSLPLYHMHGLSVLMQAMYMRKRASMYSAALPLTADNVIGAIETVRPEAVHVVPYVLGLLAEQRRGVAYLKVARMVTSSGSRTPDELGDMLAGQGVPLSVTFGSTEGGLTGTSQREPGEPADGAWNYMRFFPSIRDHCYLDPLGDGSYELVYLAGLPSLSCSNSDDPAPGCFRTSDVFLPHPEIPDAWKYIARLDDRITLVNGEKVLPLPMEGLLRDSGLVREAVVVGVDRAFPGLLLFRAPESDHLTDEQYLETIWPTIVAVNAQAERFAQIAPEMVKVLSSDSTYPQTDKGTIIRARLYKEFAEEIDELYSRSEKGDDRKFLSLSLPDLEEFLKRSCEEVMGTALDSLDTDLFAAGVDSLQAIQLGRKIQSTIDLKGSTLGANVVYEQRTIRGLADHVHALGQGKAERTGPSPELISSMINKYSDFGDVVILTGATGSMGAHLLAKFTRSSYIRKVYCLVRGQKPMDRVVQSLEKRKIKLDRPSMDKVAALTSDLSKEDFGLREPIFKKLRSEATLIIHVAWPVNFNLQLQSFEPQLVGLQNLIKFSLSVSRPQPARLMFCSSVSTAHSRQGPALVAEDAVHEFGHTAAMGYAQSKLVGEHMVMNAAAAGARACVLRIGQVVGDAENGIWNDQEMVPSMIRSALAMKALPDLNEACAWLPVDTLAAGILELSQELARRSHTSTTGEEPIFFNLVNPRTFRWADLLAELRAVGLEFETVTYGEWLMRLEESAARGEEARNPAVKLADYFTQHMRPSDVEGRDVLFETTTAQEFMPSLRGAPRILEEGYVKLFLQSWLPQWG